MCRSFVDLLGGGGATVATCWLFSFMGSSDLVAIASDGSTGGDVADGATMGSGCCW